MNNSKMKKLYTSIITSILLILAMFNGTVYAKDISERYSYDSSIADEAFEYGTIYDATSFPNKLSNGIDKTYESLLEELKNNEYYENGYNEDEYKTILLNQIHEIEPNYSSNDLEEIRTKWLQVKKDFAENHLTILETLEYNNTNSFAWNNDFYNNWHLLCLAWGKSIESTKVEFRKLSYQYATPSMSFIMNTQADGKNLRNNTLYEYLTEGENSVDLTKIGSKWGMLGQYFATLQQFSMWMQFHEQSANGFNDDGKIASTNNTFIGQYEKAINGEVAADNVVANMTAYEGIDEGYTLKECTNDIMTYSRLASSILSLQYNTHKYSVYGIAEVDDKITGITKKDIRKLYYNFVTNTNINYSESLTSNSFTIFRKNGSSWDIIDENTEIIDKDMIVFDVSNTIPNQDIENISIDNNTVKLFASVSNNSNATTNNTYTETQTDLNTVANDYENFIKGIAKLDNGNFKYVPITHTVKVKDDNGNEIDKDEKFMFPEIDTEKITKLANDSISVKYDNDNFLIGPFTMGSSSYSTKIQGNVYDFAKVDNFKITVNTENDGTRELTSNEWQYLYNGNPDDNAPPAGTEFYIIIKSQDGMTEVNGLKYDYKYLVSAANYYYFHDGFCNGNEEIAAQEQAMIDNTARWYEQKEVNLVFDNSCINITKKAIDGEGKDFSTDKPAKFRITIYDGNVEKESKDVEVTPGNTVQYRFQKTSDNMKYKVEEIDIDENYWNIDKLEDNLDNKSNGDSTSLEGDIGNNTQINVVATNKMTKHNGTLKIIKIVDGKVDKDKEFNFILRINYNDGNKVTEETITVPVSQGSNETRVSRTITWYGDNVPTYQIKESPDNEYELESITNNEGSLADNKTITVTAVNKKIAPEPVKLIIRKEIDGDVPTDDTFNFTIWTTGAINNLGGSKENAVPIMGLKPGVDYPFTFYPESKDTSVEYHITEELPDGDDSKWKLKSFEVSENGEIIKISDKKTVEGTLKEGTSIKIIATNEQNAPNTGSLTIDKYFENESDKTRIAQFNVKIEVPEDFKFESVPNVFEDNPKTLEDGKTYYVLKNNAEIEIQPNTNGTFSWIKEGSVWKKEDTENPRWTSGVFTWYGDYKDDIKYHVEEVKVLEVDGNGDYKEVTEEYNTPTSIDNPTGTFGGEVYITSTNKLNKENKNVINLTKKIAGEADGDEYFVFKVNVGNETEYVALKVKAGEEDVSSYKVLDSEKINDENYIKENEGYSNTSNGTWTSKEYTWLESENVPEYTIEEVKVIANRTYTPVITPQAGAEYEVLENGKGIKGKLDGSKAEIDVQAMNYADVDLKIKKVCVDDDGNHLNVNKETTVTVDVFVKAPTGEFNKPEDFSEETIDGVKYYTKKGVELKLESGKSESEIVNLGKFSWIDEEYNLYDEKNVIIKETKIEGDTSFVFDEKDEKSVDVKSNNGLYFEIKNKKAKKHDKLSITKMLAEPADDVEYFIFKINIAGETKYAAIKVDKDGKTGTQHATISSNNVNELIDVEWIDGGEWSSDEYYWYTDENAPKYNIEEVKAYKGSDYNDITGLYKPQMTPSNEGQLIGTTSNDENHLETHVDILNTAYHASGTLIVKKELTDELKGIIKPTFNFNVTIEQVEGIELVGAENEKIELPISVQAGSKKRIDCAWKYVKKADGTIDTTLVPKYTVIELDTSLELKDLTVSPSEGTTVDNNNRTVTGYLTKNDSNSEENEAQKVVIATFTNGGDIKKGNIQVTKKFQDDKKITASSAEAWAKQNDAMFTAQVTVKAAEGGKIFEKIKESDNYHDEIIDINKGLDEKTYLLYFSKDNGWTDITDDIYWTGDEPSYTVTEINIPAAWSFVEGANLTGNLGKDATVDATITNKPRSAIILTMELGGRVWEDKVIDKKNATYYSKTNGVYDEGNDFDMENVTVNVYKKIYNRSDSSQVGNIPVKSTKTNKDGIWRVQRLGIPTVTNNDLNNTDDITQYYADYDVEFEYDGQKYKTVDALKKKIVEKGEITGVEDGNKTELINGDSDTKEKYADSSLATETSNNSNSITEVKGGTPIAEDGTTVGTVTYNGNDEKIYYKKTDDSDPARSILQTTDADGNVYDIFKATANTSNEGLTFPFGMSEGINLSNADSTIGISNVGITKDPQNEYQISVNNNDVYKLYAGNYQEISDKKNAPDGDYYLKNSASANYIIDDAGNYIVPKNNQNGYIIVHKADGKYTVNQSENFIITDNYKAIYNYCQHINLGLEERDPVDISLEKTLESVKVVVREKMYQFNWLDEKESEMNKDGLFKYIKANGEAKETGLQLGLYKTDYYYRAEIYDGTVRTKYSDFYTTMNKTLDDTEMDIYLTYKLTLKNNSTEYDVKINSIDDYYDENLTLVTENETKFLKTKKVGSNGAEETINAKETVAEAFAYGNDELTFVEKVKDTSDGITYNKMTLNHTFDLKAEESQDLRMAFKVNKDLDRDSIILGQHANIAEIGSYSSYYKDTDNTAGKIDWDSAPGNLNLKHNGYKVYNEESGKWEMDYTDQLKWLEDDSASAPIVNIQIRGEAEDENTSTPTTPTTTPGNDRNVTGTAWEDQRTESDENGYKYGNGIKDSGIFEKAIEGLTTELVEKVMVPNTDEEGKITYTAYDFVWPTDKVLVSLGNNSIENISEFKASTTTGENGDYSFKNIPVGDYVVRFTYGDKEIATAKYENENSANFYNGQDYKSSIYPNVDTIPSVLDLNNYNNASANNSNVAVDSEVRRLQVIQKSREITNKNGKILAASSSDERYATEANKEKLLADYYMWADTPMIRLSGDKSYNLNNIDFALEERPLTELSLDKQIKEILIKTSDGKTLMDAVYDISYDVDNKGKVKAKVSLNETQSIGTENLQALNRDAATNNGFRYINVDSEVLQGATISVTYQFAAINSGEIDYTSEALSKDDFDFNSTCKTLSDKLVAFNENKNSTNDTAIGTYLGHAYYYGTKGEKDQVVTTSVKELVDYMDNDVVFDTLMNNESNRSWRITTNEALNELTENTGKLTDSKGVEYSTTGNLITSTEDNSNLMTQLSPERNNGSYTPSAIIELTVSKFVAADSDDLQIDNIAEIIRYTNTVGRRDILAVTGNTNPAKVYEEISTGRHPDMPYERDTSATETVTLSPPTGSSLMIWRLQVIGAITAGMVIIAGGIILIKKKVLK